MRVFFLALIPLALLAPAAFADDHSSMPAPAATTPPLYPDLGDWTMKITTSNPEAQKYFDQGLRFCYGFNHDEAVRAFREALRRDPDCAMAWWGIAYASGPNINLPMDEDHARVALEAAGKAKSLEGKVSAKERDFIDAVAVRYSADAGASRAGLDSAYADAMRSLAKKYPADADAGALAAEAMMDLNPWNQWAHDGKPNPGTLEVVSRLEAVLKAHPEHPGANHFYIHAVEASPHPERALAAAGRLETLVPGAGHLVHMPSHIYARVGRYDDSVKRNRIAAAVDEKYIAEQNPQGVYPLMYYNHNLQFIMFSAMMEGRSQEAIEAARKVAGNVTPELISQMSMLEFVPPYPLLTLAQFGRWDELLKEPAPPESQKYATGMWHYARGLALAATGDMAGARGDLASVEAAAKTVPADMMISINFAPPLLRIATHALAGEIAAREKRWDAAVTELRAGVAAEDSLHYDEPPTWYSPVREPLGAVLLKAGRAREAEAVYRADLARHPENGWALHGLARAIRAQGRAAEAAAIEKRFEKAWARADVKLADSEY